MWGMWTGLAAARTRAADRCSVFFCCCRCVGGEGDQEHDVAWFELHEGHPLACDLCGQYFELVKVAPPSVSWDAA